MPRPGGDSDKLGNRYEGIWTIGRLLQIASREFEMLTVEPIGDDVLGIEFVIRGPGDACDFHSVKRQRSTGEWSLAELARRDKNSGRSIVGDLFDRLAADDAATCRFVSSTGANDLRELTERARRRNSLSDFRADLNSSDRLRQALERYVIPASSNDLELAYNYLRRLRVVLIDEATLIGHVEQHIAYLVYRPDSRDFEDIEVRVLLGDFIQENLGSALEHDAIWTYLSQFGYAKRDWATDTIISSTVRDRNSSYKRAVEFELINGARIPRGEARTITDEISRDDGARTVLLSAVAGGGKSCVVTQLLDGLESDNVPVLVVRMDRHGDARTTQELGAQLGLPRSPTVVLAGMANGRDSVLIIDQLDAVSQVSGRYPHLWEVFDALCAEAAAFPNMRVVIACRDFDLQHDQRLRKLKRPATAKHVSVKLLSTDDVDAAISAAGGTGWPLTAREREILRTPLHLMLFLEGMGDRESAVGFRNIGELFDRFWEQKQRRVSERLGHPSAWSVVVDKLCTAMSDALTLYVPAVLLDDCSETAAVMLTEHVLVRDGNQVRFFHESFFDYAFARRFCGGSKRLVTFLGESEQHLFRRSQVRQILVFLRDHDRSRYLAELREILTAPAVRFHIKRLVLAWLGTVPDPTAAEWEIVEPLLDDCDLQHHVLPPIRNSLPWFDRLHEIGVIGRWLDSPSEDMIRRGMWFLMFDQVQKHRSEIAATLLAPFRGRCPAWMQRLKTYFRFGHAHHSRPIQDLFLQLVDDGAFEETTPDQHDSLWNRLRESGKEAPLFALAAVARWLDRWMANVSLLDEGFPAEDRDYDRSASQLIGQIAQQEPVQFIDEILPRVLNLVTAFSIDTKEGLRADKVWCWHSNGEPMSVHESLFDELLRALEHLATEFPGRLETVMAPLTETDSLTVTFLLLRVWSANPGCFGNECISFLVADPRRLDVGYGSWSGGGNGHAAISREAIQACLLQATPGMQEQLERAILSFSPAGEVGTYEGWHQRLLLEAYGEDHLSDAGRKRLLTLRAKFPEQDTGIPPRRSGGVRCVGSPIPVAETEEFTDDDWLEAMRQYDYGWDGSAKGIEQQFDGTAVELSRVLQPQARRNKRRFAALASRMDDSLRPEYFDAILDGICGAENLSKDERQADREQFERLETELVLNLIRRLHRLPNRPCGRSICRGFECLSQRSIPEADLQILAHYAIEDADPATNYPADQTIAEDKDPSDQAHFQGYNSVRGSAARTIASLLFADYSRSTVLLPLICRMVRDPSLAVRTCVADALLPVWNHERDESVRLFLELCKDADVVFGSRPFEDFVRYACSTHYAELRGVLQQALRSTSHSAIAVAARQICLAAFTDESAESDADEVRNGTETMRRASTEVYAYNLGDQTVGSTCQKHLLRFFEDDSEEVRATAAACFLHLENPDFSQYSDFIQSYIGSHAFPSQHDHLLRRLEDSTWRLPEITIGLAERFVVSCGSDAGDFSTAAAGDATTVSKLVLRLYAQSSEDEVRTKCLDLIDEMERLAFFGIDSQLAEHDR